MNGFVITDGVINGAKKVVFYGPEGIGKSTFASQFPDPLFIEEVLYRQNSFPVSSPEECLALHVGLPPGIPAGDLWHLMFWPLPDMPCLHSGYRLTMRS